jgi:predicted neuraminidase
MLTLNYKIEVEVKQTFFRSSIFSCTVETLDHFNEHSNLRKSFVQKKNIIIVKKSKKSAIFNAKNLKFGTIRSHSLYRSIQNQNGLKLKTKKFLLL